MSQKIPDALAQFDQLPGSAFIRLPIVLGLKSCSRVTLWRQVKEGLFPAPHKIGARMVAWRVSEVRAALGVAK